MDKKHVEDILMVIKQIKVAKYQLKKYLKVRFPAIYEMLLSLTSFLGNNEEISIHERIYCVEHSLKARPKCSVCHQRDVPFNAMTGEYKKWCSIPCSCKDPATIAKSRQTRLEKYGNPTYVGVERARATRAKRSNGKWNYSDFGEKCRKTKLKHFGDEHYINIEKIRQTKLKRYGSETWTNQEKIKQTKLERYGDPYWNNRDQFLETLSTFSQERKDQINEARKKTNLSRYGAEYATQAEKTKAKSRETCLKRYGKTSSLSTAAVKDKAIRAIKMKSWKMIQSDADYEPLFSEEEYVSCRDSHHKWLWKHKACCKTFESEYDNGQHHRCFACWPNNNCGTSLLEQEIRDYVKSILPGIDVYNKSPENRRIIPHREIDIWIPSKKLAIEVDGLYYHTAESGKGRRYHLEKTEACEKQGIQLIHIFEDEWHAKKDVVKKLLREALGISNADIDAKTCSVIKLSNDEKDELLSQNHIEGKDASKLRYGLKSQDGRAVAVMTFAKPRFSKRHDWQLSRFASLDCIRDRETAAQILLQAFEQEAKPKSVITFVDRRWSNGSLAKHLGFELSEAREPMFQYVKNGQRFSRVMFQKKTLASKLEKFDPSLSEAKNMEANGYQRIYDCGQLAFVKTYANLKVNKADEKAEDLEDADRVSTRSRADQRRL